MLIYVSSVHAIPEKSDGDLISEVSIFNPDDVVGLYAKTKAEAARYVMDSVKDKGLNACIVHPSGILGPYDFSNEKAKRDLGFVTRDITDTVRDMVMWILGDFKE